MNLSLMPNLGLQNKIGFGSRTVDDSPKGEAQRTTREVKKAVDSFELSSPRTETQETMREVKKSVDSFEKSSPRTVTQDTMDEFRDVIADFMADAPEDTDD